MSNNALAANNIPSTADAGRLKPVDTTKPNYLPASSEGLVIQENAPKLEIPKGAEDIKFVLKEVEIRGATAFPHKELSKFYAEHINQNISLTTIYKIADSITQHYRNEGYFLSSTVIPNQEIKNGSIIIEVKEGYISKVEVSDASKDSRILQSYVDRLVANKPLSYKTLERFLLQINDLPGLSFRSVLSPQNKSEDNGVLLTLIPTKRKDYADVSLNNFNSRYLGPHQLSMNYNGSIIPLQQTNLSYIQSMPAGQLGAFFASQSVPVMPDLDMQFSAALTNVKPGFTLKPFEIESRSTDLGLGFNYQWIRSKQQNMVTGIKMNAQKSNSYTLGTQITDDIIRAIRANVEFDTSDKWNGYSYLNMILSQGIDGFGSQKQNPSLLSRVGAEPDFTKFEFSLARIQWLSNNWSIFMQGAGQKASGTLYSAEQFGYGGQIFGRSFDASEIIGDEGISGSVEIRYDGFSIDKFELQPFYFYDSTYIKSYSNIAAPHDSASSTGGGIRFTTPWNQSGLLMIAYPVGGNTISTPIYGSSENGPRLSFQISQRFSF